MLSLYFLSLVAVVLALAFAAALSIRRRDIEDDPPVRPLRLWRFVGGFWSTRWVERNLFKKLPRFA